MDMKGILVFGGRDFTDYDWLDLVVKKAIITASKAGERPNFVISGAAEGADRLAVRWAEQNGFPFVLCPYWRFRGREGGHARNRFMAEFFRPVISVGFPGGPGTASMWSILRELELWAFEAEELAPKPQIVERDGGADFFEFT